MCVREREREKERERERERGKRAGGGEGMSPGFNILRSQVVNQGK